MINKKLSILAGAVLAVSSSQAAFNNDSIVFVAVNGAGDTYVADLGNLSTFPGSTTAADPSGLGSYSWTVVGTNETGTPLAAPPGLYQPTADTGILSTTSSTGSTTISTSQNVGFEIAGVRNWLADVQTAAAGSSTVTIPSGNAGAYLAGMQVAHQGSAMQSGSGDFDLFGIYQNSGAANSTPVISDGLVTFNFDGSTVSAVPVPAAAWLFGSALAGLTVIRRRK
ncbi:MAG: VPLPA-CTERM sorting domain-containing protein [Pseudomonadales bacterium]|nr:VPLPA-CTERM sorting domain-containing protein [Pseudomonadales bacterium]